MPAGDTTDCWMPAADIAGTTTSKRLSTVRSRQGAIPYVLNQTGRPPVPTAAMSAWRACCSIGADGPEHRRRGSARLWRLARRHCRFATTSVGRAGRRNRSSCKANPG